jgi:hypothetical protein
VPNSEEARFEAVQYALRASFYYRANARWLDKRALVEDLAEPASWEPLADIGISQIAANRVRELGITFTKVFAHPASLQAKPEVVGYYRGLALLPMKGIQRLGFGTTSLEMGRGRLSNGRATQLANLLNGLISLQVESDQEWTLERAEIAATLNLGSQINGSWRNTIGEEGNRQVKSLLVSVLAEQGSIDRVIINDTAYQPPIEPDDAVKAREIHTTNNFVIRFGSEPDVSVINPSGLLVGTIEVKYGSDPAGALERYGAAKKSFEEAVRANIRVQNVYLANVITPEVRRRIDEDRLVSEVFEFGKLTVDQAERERFLRFVTRRLLDL